MPTTDLIYLGIVISKYCKLKNLELKNTVVKNLFMFNASHLFEDE